MASISTDKSGNRRVLWVDADGQRRQVRLGKIPLRAAEAIQTRIEHIVADKKAGQPWDGPTAQWVAGLGDELAGKLAAVGLIPVRHRDENRGITLGQFIDQYISGRKDVKPRTTINLEQAKRHLIEHFGADKPLGDITPGDADEYRIALMGRLAENTARRHCGRAKQFFKAALRKRLIPENPFADMKGVGVKANPSRLYFVPAEDAQRVLDACPDAEWRLLFALARYGGLRTPSESLGLRWQDIDWEHGRMTVRSPKTEHHDGKESRVVPIFPELRPHLEAAWDAAEPGAVFVVTRYRDASQNLRTQLERIIGRAGVKPWPRLWQNLRSTRETELAQRHPIHVVCAWIGNSAPVAAKHYLQVTEADFAQAVAAPAATVPEAAQYPAQYASGMAGKGVDKKQQTLEIPEEYEGLLTCTSVQMPPDGLEPSTL